MSSNDSRAAGYYIVLLLVCRTVLSRDGFNLFYITATLFGLKSHLFEKIVILFKIYSYSLHYF